MVSTIPGGAGFLPSTVSLLVSTSKSSDFGSARDQVVATSRMIEQNVEGWSCIKITDISVTPWEIDPRPRLWTGSHPWHRLGSNRGFFFCRTISGKGFNPEHFNSWPKMEMQMKNMTHDPWNCWCESRGPPLRKLSLRVTNRLCDSGRCLAHELA